MPTSQNGYSANDRTRIASYTIPGTSERVALRKGDCSVVLLDLAGFIHDQVVDIETRTLDEWGYAERTIRGSSTTLSNHASGTAIDIDAQKHPLGVEGTWTAAQRRKIHDRLKLYNGVVRWGEDYHGRVDGMHFEISLGKAAVGKVADRIRAGRLGDGALSYLVGRKPFAATKDTPPTLRVGDHGPEVKALQRALNQWLADHYPKRQKLDVDGQFGDHTRRVVELVEAHHGLTVNGVAGNSVWKALED